MFIGNQRQFQPNALKELLDANLDGVRVGNGTPLADVVLSALEIDSRISLGGLHDDNPSVSVNVLELAFEILRTISLPNRSMTLPFGTLVETKHLGHVEIGGEVWVLNAAAPGLHPMQITRKDAHGPNLELLHKLISRQTRNLACRRLGLPHPKGNIADLNLLYFAPHDDAGGVMLSCWANGTDAPRFCAAFPAQIEAFAKEIVTDMRLFWKRRKEIARQADEVRAVAEARIASCNARVASVVVHLTTQRTRPDLDMCVLYDGTDIAMRRGTVLDTIPFSMRKSEGVSPQLRRIERRDEEMKMLRSSGASGRISGPAAAVLLSGLVDKGETIAALSTGYEITFDIRTGATTMFVTLFWDDGTIDAEITMHERIDWLGGTLDLLGVTQLPEAQLVALVGAPLSTLADLPFGGDLLIQDAELTDSGVRIQLVSHDLHINLETGRVWGPTEEKDR